MSDLIGNKVLGDEAAEALYCLGDAFLVSGDDFPQVLRVLPRRERRRADEVGEHHGNLAAFGGVLGFRLGKRRLRRCQNGT
jgi:hypothetical protein